MATTKTGNARATKQAAIRDRIVELRRVPARDLRANPKNWRRHPRDQQEAMRGVLAEIGYAGALLARETPEGLLLIDGHLRAETTPDQAVPVLILDVDEREADLLLATVDPIAAMAERDDAALAALLAGVDAEDERVRALLASLAGEEAPTVRDVDAEPQLDRAEELRAQWGVEPGQVWVLGEHRLACGDATDRDTVERVLAGDRASCVFTSPPYGVGIDYGETYTDTIESLRAMLPRLAANWHALLAPGGFAVVNFGDIVSARSIAGTSGPCEYPMAVEYWPVFRAAGFVLWSRRVWCKPVARVAAPWCASSNRSATNYEHVWTWKRDGESPRVGRVGGPMDSQSGWFDTSRLQGVDIGKDTHGAGMPVSCAVWMIGVHTLAGDIVHEPFCGTGTTVMACEQTGRRCRAIDISPSYVAIALQRWADATGGAPVREGAPAAAPKRRRAAAAKDTAA